MNKEKDRLIRQTRTIGDSLKASFQTRDETGEEIRIIEGYFALVGVETELWPGAYEEIAPGAFDATMGNDIRALVNHDSTLVLGRNRANTLELINDKTGMYGRAGLFGRISINPKDQDAVNLHERVKRGDVTQCSFGFNIESEEDDWRDDGTVKWTIKKIDLHEVSVCTFPAYKDTGVEARAEQIEQHGKRQLEVRKKAMKERIQAWH